LITGAGPGDGSAFDNFFFGLSLEALSFPSLSEDSETCLVLFLLVRMFPSPSDLERGMK
jgi:hypothetical protein